MVYVVTMIDKNKQMTWQIDKEIIKKVYLCTKIQRTGNKEFVYFYTLTTIGYNRSGNAIFFVKKYRATFSDTSPSYTYTKHLQTQSKVDIPLNTCLSLEAHLHQHVIKNEEKVYKDNYEYFLSLEYPKYRSMYLEL